MTIRAFEQNGIWSKQDGSLTERAAGFVRAVDSELKSLDAELERVAADNTFPNGLIVAKTQGIGVKVDIDTPTFGWRDITATVQPKATGGGSPARAIYAGGNLAQYAFIANDVCEFEFHLPHDYVPSTDLYFHVHWSHNGTSITGTATFTVYYTYAKGHNQQVFPAEKTLTISYDTVDLATTPQYMHRIDEVVMTDETASATLTDRDEIEVDGLILCTVKLTSLPTIGGGGKLFIHTCDIHYQSTNMATKGKAPAFY
jgi:hypothetical protein